MSTKPGQDQGDILAEKYRVDRILGSGGMGVVVAAHHLHLDERVAIKFLLPHALGNAEAVERFAREARAAVKIKSEHVARVTDVGRLANGAPYMVMEYLEGLDLAAWVQQRGPMPAEQAVEFVLQACEAIAEAHALGIVHRDLKPANLFCVRRADGVLSIKVLDFGISKAALTGGGIGQAQQAGVTRTNAIVGSPLYMSPEQMRASRDVDARADIWSLGAILFELTTGRTPFHAEELADLIVRIMTGEPTAMRSLRPDAPVKLERVVLRCLAKEPEQRFADIAELALALAEFAPGTRARASVDCIVRVIQASPRRSSRPPAAASTALQIPASTQANWGKTDAGSKTGKKALLGVGAAVLIAAAVGVVALVGALRPRTPAAAPAASPDLGVAAPVEAPSAAVALTLAPFVAPTGSQPEPAASVSTAAPTVSARATRPTAVPAVPVRLTPTPASQTPVVPAAPPSQPPVTSPRPAGCDPPYTLDDQGRKHFRPECYPKN